MCFLPEDGPFRIETFWFLMSLLLIINVTCAFDYIYYRLSINAQKLTCKKQILIGHVHRSKKRYKYSEVKSIIIYRPTIFWIVSDSMLNCFCMKFT